MGYIYIYILYVYVYTHADIISYDIIIYIYYYIWDNHINIVAGKNHVDTCILYVSGIPCV